MTLLAKMSHSVYNLNNMQELKDTLGVLVQDARKAKGWRQQQLADAVNLKRTSISNIEAGRQGMTIEQFCAIATALDCEPPKLLAKALYSSKPNDESKTLKSVVNKVDEKNIRAHILKTLK